MARARSTALAAAGLIAVVGLWFVLLGRPGIWTDEEYSLRFASSYATVDDDLHPPTYYALLRTWFLLVPDTLVSARFLSAACFVGAVVVWGALARRWSADGRLPARAVTVMVALSVLSPHTILFGRMARYFGPVALATALAVWSWWSLLERPRRPTVAAAVAAHVAVGLLSYPAFVVLAGAELATVVLRRRDRLRRQLVLGAASTVIWLLGVVLLPTDDRQFGGGDEVNRVAMAGVAVALPLWSATVGETVSPLDPFVVVPVLLAWAALAVATVAALRRTSSRFPAEPVVLLCLLLVLGTLASLVVVTVTVDLAHTGLQAPKYFAPVAPAFYVLAGLGFDRIAGAWRRGAAALVAAGLAVGWGTGLAHLYTGRDFLYPSYALPWGQVADAAEAAIDAATARGSGVLVVASDRAMLRVLADRDPAADLYDTNSPPEEALVFDGTPSPEYGVVLFVERQRLNSAATVAIDELRTVLDRQGFEVVSTRDFGSVDPGLRRLQELASGRDLEDHLVRLEQLEGP